MRKLLPVLLCAALFTGCSRGNSMIPQAKSPTGGQSAQTSVTIVIPSRVPAAIRHPQYISYNTKGMEVTAYASSDTSHSKPLADATMGLSGCITVLSGEQCTLSIAAPAGVDDIVLKTFDEAPGAGGAIPSSAHLLSTGTAGGKTIVADKANTIALTLNPVVASMEIQALDADGSHYASFTGGTPSTVNVWLTILDASGAQVVAPGTLVDANGSPVTITLSNTDTTYGNSKTTTLAQTTVTQPLSGSIALAYNGGHNESTLLTATSSSSLVANVSYTVPVYLGFTAYTSPFNTASPQDTVLGSDGAVWSTWLFSDGTSYVGRTDTSTGKFTSYALAGTNEEPEYMALGADGNIYYSDHGGAFMGPGGLEPNIGVVTTSGHISTLMMPTITDINGNTEYPIPGYVTAGPQSALWFVTQEEETVSATGVTSPLIGRVMTSGTNQITYVYPWKSIGGPVNGICAASDGSLWISVGNDYTPTGFWRVGNPAPPTAATIDFYPTSRVYSGCITGPDGKLYAAGVDSFARITMPSTVEEFPVGALDDTDIPPLAGPDGRIWITDSGGEMYFIDVATKLPVTPYPNPGGGGGKLVLDRNGYVWEGAFERIAW